MSRIIKFSAENFKRLKVVDITPEGDVVRITGRNEAGKSSTLDAIMAALAGKDALPGRPIHRGETKSTIRLELGDKETELIVTRRITEKDSTLIVEAPNGARFPSPQKMLDGMLGAISFDPLAFTRMRPEQQYAALRGLVTIDVDIDALDGQNKRDYETRTEVNREAARLRAQAASIQYPEGLPAQSPDIGALTRRLAEAGEHNATRARLVAAADRSREIEQAKRAEADGIERQLPVEIAGVEARAKHAHDQLQRQIEELLRQQSELVINRDAEIAMRREEMESTVGARRAEADALKAEREGVPALPDAIDMTALSLEIEHARHIADQIDARSRHLGLEAAAKIEEERSEALTDAMAERDKQKRAAISAAVMPVSGLGFGDGEVLFNDLPIDQAGHAEQIRISAAIAMAANPKIRVMLIRDGSLLDERSMKILTDMIRQHDYQLWIEEVSRADTVGIVLEDGMVVGAAPPAAPGKLL